LALNITRLVKNAVNYHASAVCKFMFNPMFLFHVPLDKERSGQLRI